MISLIVRKFRILIGANIDISNYNDYYLYFEDLGFDKVSKDRVNINKPIDRDVVTEKYIITIE